MKKPTQEQLSKKQGAVKRTASTTDWCQSPVLPVALLKGPSTTYSQGTGDHHGAYGMGGERVEWCLEESSSVFQVFHLLFPSIPNPVTKSSLIGNKLN